MIQDRISTSSVTGSETESTNDKAKILLIKTNLYGLFYKSRLFPDEEQPT